MASLFLKIFNMSMVAGWVILAVILLRLLLRRAPKWLTCALWAVVALRLICPFSIESMFSLIPSAEIISPTEIQFSASPTIDTGIPVINNTLNPVIQDSLAAAPEASLNPVQIWILAGRVIWAIGLIVMLGYAAVNFLRIRRMLAEAVAFQDNVYLCDAVNSPFIFGLLHPGIYLPSDIDEGQLDYVLAHERAHLKRLDHVWKILGYFLLAVYWFNPLVWVAYILLCRDIELACDERVVHDLDLNGKKAYSVALVACSTKRRMITFCPLAFGEVGVKERVKTVLNYKKPKLWLVATAVVAYMIAAVCFLTNPQKDSETDGMLNAQNEQEDVDIAEIIKAENEQKDPKITEMIEASKKLLEITGIAGTAQAAGTTQAAGTAQTAGTTQAAGTAQTAGTAQAAGTNAKSKCKHLTVHLYEEVIVAAKFYNGHDHVSLYETGYKCTTEGCSYTMLDHKEYRYEPHDYEQTYYRDGSVRSTCIDCKDTF